jgi:hypothetical protein
MIIVKSKGPTIILILELKAREGSSCTTITSKEDSKLQACLIIKLLQMDQAEEVISSTQERQAVAT